MDHSPTPQKLTKAILSLCKKIAPQQKPIYLDVTPTEFSEPLDCFENVREQIERYGGRMVLGWEIWEWPTNMIEAEFHAVWQSPDGKLIDITSKPIPVPRILFLSDPDQVYTGRQVDNIRIPLRDNPLIKEFIEINEKIFEYMNTGELADYYGPIPSPEKLQKRKAFLQEKINLQKIKPNEKCPCGSGKKYKKCCL